MKELESFALIFATIVLFFFLGASAYHKHCNLLKDNPVKADGKYELGDWIVYSEMELERGKITIDIKEAVVISRDGNDYAIQKPDKEIIFKTKKRLYKTRTDIIDKIKEL